MAPKPTREEIEEAFNKVDKDGVGKLTKDQLRTLIINIEDEKNRGELEKNTNENENIFNILFNMADEDGDKMVSLEEILKLLEIGEEKDQFDMMKKMLKA